jgi:hypothetical protein
MALHLHYGAISARLEAIHNVKPFGVRTQFWGRVIGGVIFVYVRSPASPSMMTRTAPGTTSHRAVRSSWIDCVLLKRTYLWTLSVRLALLPNPGCRILVRPLQVSYKMSMNTFTRSSRSSGNNQAQTSSVVLHRDDRNTSIGNRNLVAERQPIAIPTNDFPINDYLCSYCHDATQFKTSRGGLNSALKIDVKNQLIRTIGPWHYTRSVESLTAESVLQWSIQKRHGIHKNVA